MPGVLKADSVGPVDVAVVTFEGNQMNGDIAPALTELQDRGIVRLIDLAFVRKEDHGPVTIVQVSDAEVNQAYREITDPRFDLLADEDLRELTSALRPGTSAMVVVWENTWAARFGAAVRESKGQVTAFERIPFERVQRALAEVEEDRVAEAVRPPGQREG